VSSWRLHPAVTQRVQGGGKVAGGGEAVGVVGAEVLAVAVENVPVLACPMPRISETEPTRTGAVERVGV
jgi:hypothetical protein